MISRAVAPGIVLFWLAAMSWLVWHDVRPIWMAQDPPRTVSTDWVKQGSRVFQAGIQDKHGGHIGTIWTIYHAAGGTLAREDIIAIDRFPGVAPARIDIESQFDDRGKLDELTADVAVAGIRIGLQAERFGSQLACEIRTSMSPRRHTLKIADSDAATIGDLFKPFSDMTDLHVGQTWRMQVFNPMGKFMGGDKFIPMIVRVTGKETAPTRDGPVECFVVEALNARALVAPDGTVVVQETELPIGGKIVIRDEPFDEDLYLLTKSMSLPPIAEFPGNGGDTD